MVAGLSKAVKPLVKSADELLGADTAGDTET